jgi:hypothetical protein
VDPDIGSVSRRAKMAQKNRKQFLISSFEVLDALLRAEGFPCSLAVLPL